ncbi:MAG TPA: hypothetical protein VF576_08755 [Rubricoccaceae bacterium]|jgi:hypothetical protein
MTPEEFNRLKEEEKAHLRQLRDLKQQHREVQRKTSILGALRGMRNPELEADTDARTEELMRGAVTQEARLDLALEGEAERAAAEADREALRQAEAAALVRQFKADAGATADEKPARPSPTADAPARTIGRTPAPPEAPPQAPRDEKTIGRSGAS